MPVVLTDSTNRVWAVEQPDDGLLHVGITGKAGPRLVDALDFLATREKQFDKFVEKRREAENADKRRVRQKRANTRNVESGGDSSLREE
jgi:hypothetical protein